MRKYYAGYNKLFVYMNFTECLLWKEIVVTGNAVDGMLWEAAGACPYG